MPFGYSDVAVERAFPVRFRRRLHESVVDVMADAVIGTDLEYRVTLWNPAAERLYGYSAEEAMGRPARELAT